MFRRAFIIGLERIFASEIWGLIFLGKRRRLYYGNFTVGEGPLLYCAPAFNPFLTSCPQTLPSLNVSPNNVEPPLSFLSPVFLLYSPFSRGVHVKSQENKSFFFCPSKLVFKFFTARLDGQNVLCLCKTAAA